MPKVCSMGRQSAMSDGISAGRRAAACNPSSVSCSPRRSSRPSTRNSTLPMKGTRQPQAATCSGFNSTVINQAQPEPRMNPMVVPTAVELLTRPRLADGANSVVYTIDPVNSPPTEKPCSSRSATSRMGAATPIDRISRQQSDEQRRATHERDRQHQQRAAADAIPDRAQHQAANGPAQESDPEHRKCEQQLRTRARLAEKIAPPMTLAK